MNKSIALVSWALIFFGTGSSLSVMAQVQLPSEEVQVVRDFDARLASSERLLIYPALPSMDTTQLSYDFSIKGRQLEYNYEPPQIRALGIGRPTQETTYSSFLRAGYGMPQSPLFDGYSSFRGDKYKLFAEGNHYQVNNRNNVENQIIGQTQLGLGGGYVFSPFFAVDGALKYDYWVRDLYGYDAEIDSFSQDEAARRFNIFQADISVSSPQKNSWGLGYEFQLDFRNTSDNVEAKENKTHLGGTISWDISEKQSFNLHAQGLFLNFSDSTGASPRLNVYTLRPTYAYRAGNISASAGIYLASGNANFFFPEVHLEYGLLENQVIAYAGSQAAVEDQGFSRLSSRNPYFTNTMDSLYVLENWEIYGGVKGRFQQLAYNFNLAYQNFKNLAFFTPKVNDTRVFDAFYESGSVFDLSLNLKYPLTDRLTGSLIINQKFFSLDSLAGPLLTPTFTADFRTDYVALSSKLHLWMEARFQQGVEYLNREAELDRLGNLFDVSLGADYYFTEHWGIFVHGYNLSNNTRQRWTRYPIIGRNILGGLLVRF